MAPAAAREAPAPQSARRTSAGNTGNTSSAPMGELVGSSARGPSGLRDEPVFAARPVGSSEEIRAIERSRLRTIGAGSAQVEPIDVDPIKAGDCVQRITRMR